MRLGCVQRQGSGSLPDREYVFNISRFLSLPTYLSGALVCSSKWHPTYLWMQRAAGAILFARKPQRSNFQRVLAADKRYRQRSPRS